jgi:hypothetical protein
MSEPNKHDWSGEGSIFWVDTCLICTRLIINGTGKAEHARMHVRNGEAIRTGDGTEDKPFRYTLTKNTKIMSTQKTIANNPAFPRPIGNSGAPDYQDREVNTEQEGVTIREYFIAHAPAEPWAWFQPNLENKPTPPKSASDPVWEFTEQEQHTAEGWQADAVYDLTGSPRLDSFSQKWTAYRQAKIDFDDLKKHQRDIQ